MPGACGAAGITLDPVSGTPGFAAGAAPIFAVGASAPPTAVPSWAAPSAAASDSGVRGSVAALDAAIARINVTSSVVATVTGRISESPRRPVNRLLTAALPALPWRRMTVPRESGGRT
jgi:hypothetical protein